MNTYAFKESIYTMSGEAKHESTMLERIIKDVIQNNTRADIRFTERYRVIVEPLKKLGWTTNCFEWNYDFENNVKLSVLSTNSGYTLTVSI